MGNCFVIMGFGEKTDFQSNPQRVLNLNKTYENIIKPMVIEAGLDCVRADEIIHSTVIDKPMYDNLLGADLVIADLSTSNANALYELGVRHAFGRVQKDAGVVLFGIDVQPRHQRFGDLAHDCQRFVARAEGAVLHRRDQRQSARVGVQAPLHRRRERGGQLRAGQHLGRSDLQRDPERHLPGHSLFSARRCG